MKDGGFGPRLILSAVISIMLGVTASVLVWGMATFRPLVRGAAWQSQLLSIFRFLRGLAQDPVLLIALVGYFGWLAAFDVFYASIGGFITPYGRWMWVDEVVGLPAFVLGCLLFVAVIRSTRDHGVRQLAPGATT